VIFFGAGVLILPRLAPAASLTGNILLQVQSRGEAWYIYPGNGQRYYLKDGTAAFALMRSLGLGISESDYNKLAAGNTALRASVKGKIVLRVQARGEAYFLCPRTGTLSYLKDGAAAYSVMRQCGLGITNADLAKVAISKNSASPTIAPAIPLGCAYNNPSCDTSNQCVNNKCTLKDGCAYGNPSCGNPKICINNVCAEKTPSTADNSLASGCASNNPPCDASHTCQNNECVLLSGCNYNNPACSSTQDCVNNTCVDKEVACATPACMADHQAQAYTGSTTGTGSYLLALGATKEILPNIFVRAESGTLGSIWVKKSGVCYIKKTVNPPGGLVVGDKFIIVNAENGSLRFNVYGGYQAYDLCKKMFTVPTLAIFCEALPKADSYTITGKMFSRVFDGTQYAPAQSLSVDLDDIAYSKDVDAYPAIAESQPFTGKWQITDIKSANMPNGAAGYTDLENIVVADDYVMKNTTYSYLNNYSTNSKDYQNAMNAVKNGNPNDIYISNLVWGPFNAETHEFTHGIFGNSGMMLGSYSGYSGILIEGWANYMGNIGNLSAAFRDDFSNRYCGETQFTIQPNPPENYSDIINSDPYSSGQCFFSAVEKACGTSTINGFIDKMLTEPNNPQTSYPHPLKILGDLCPDKGKYQTILNNFGIKEDLMIDGGPLVAGLLPGNACQSQ